MKNQRRKGTYETIRVKERRAGAENQPAILTEAPGILKEGLHKKRARGKIQKKRNIK